MRLTSLTLGAKPTGSITSTFSFCNLQAINRGTVNNDQGKVQKDLGDTRMFWQATRSRTGFETFYPIDEVNRRKKRGHTFPRGLTHRSQ